MKTILIVLSFLALISCAPASDSPSGAHAVGVVDTRLVGLWKYSGSRCDYGAGRPAIHYETLEILATGSKTSKFKNSANCQLVVTIEPNGVISFSNWVDVEPNICMNPSTNFYGEVGEVDRLFDYDDERVFLPLRFPTPATFEVARVGTSCWEIYERL